MKFIFLYIAYLIGIVGILMYLIYLHKKIDRIK